MDQGMYTGAEMRNFPVAVYMLALLFFGLRLNIYSGSTGSPFRPPFTTDGSI